MHIEDNPEKEGETNVTLSTATREDGFSGLPTGLPGLDIKLKGLNLD